MKLFLLLVATAYIASATPVQEPVVEEVQEKQYSRFIEFPDGEGNMHTVDLEAEPDMDALNEYERNPNNNEYLVFTRSNQLFSQTLIMNNANSVRNSNFNPNVPTYFIIHGWLSSRYTEPNPTLRRALLNKANVNVITVCWRLRAALDYVTAARGVPDIGRAVGQFINFLVNTIGVRYEDIHLGGFSLGAHVAGNAGRATGGRVARVTGLDPAGPLWTAGSDRLRAGDSVYTEAIHTDGGIAGLGIGSAIAHADFFPNGGNSMPGCLTSLCNHNRAWELFGASITYNHLVGRECTSTTQITLNTCRGQELRLGNDDLRKTGRGMYRLDAGRNYPY